jgi:drug/metabolite transporter (DMT)-like permease
MTGSTRAEQRTARARRRIRPDHLAALALVLVTTMWGSTFVIIKDVVARLPVADFLAIRFVIAAAFLTLLFGRRIARLPRHLLAQGFGLGALYGVAQVLQTTGLARASASVTGFVTGTFVVLTPILGLVLLRHRVGRMTWLATGLATVGLALLSLNGAQVSSGVLLVLAAAVLYALHIIGLGLWSSPKDALGLAAVQMIAIAVVCLIGAAPGGITLPSDTNAWLATVYTGLAAGALAMMLQTWAQAHLSATRAAIVMTLEPVAAAAFAVGFGESLTARMVLGGLLVLGAMYLVELAPGESRPSAGRTSEFLHHEV